VKRKQGEGMREGRKICVHGVVLRDATGGGEEEV